MTDIREIAENITHAMQALDQAHEASEQLREQASPETLNHFQEDMEILRQHLQAMQRVLAHEEGYFVEELSDLLHKMFTGRPAPYRSIPKVNER